MQVQVNVKRFGKRRNAIETHPYEIGAVHSIGGLIAAFVTAEVTRFNERAAAGETALTYLTSEEIADAATVGKVGFGADYNGKVQDTTAAIANAHVKDCPLRGGRQDQGSVYLGADQPLTVSVERVLAKAVFHR